MKNRILSFGHLPLFIGGKQSSGLAIVQWFIANNINKFENSNYEVIFAATDIHQSKKVIDKTVIIGWSIKSLLKFISIRPHLVVFYLFKTIKLNLLYQFSFWNLFFKLIFYHKSIYEINPEFIHLHGCTSVIFFEIFGIQKFKIFATIHGINGQDKCIAGYSNYMKMEKALNSLPFKFIVYITNDLILQWNYFYGKPNWPMKVISNAYDSEDFYLELVLNKSKVKDNNRKLTIATIASLSERKGQLRVLEALAKLDNPKIEYICIGIGTDQQIDILKCYAQKNNISFKYLGYKTPTEIRSLLIKIDYMILPSSSEGFGLVFLESIACGVPVILPKNLPIVKEDGIINNENSILLQDESSCSIAEILNDLNKYNFIREKVAASIINHNWENIVVDYLKLLSEI